MIYCKLVRQIIQDAVDTGNVELVRVGRGAVPDSSKALLMRRCHFWGLLFMMRMMGVLIQSYAGFYLPENWFKLSATDRARSFAQTLKRIILRGWRWPLSPIIKSNRLRESGGSESTLMNLDKFKSQCKV